MKMTNKKRIKQSPAMIATLSIFFVLIAAHAFSLLYPLFWAGINSLKTGKAFEISSMNLPNPVVWSNFEYAFEKIRCNGVDLIGMIGNSVWICVLGVASNTLACMLVAYCVARFRFPGRNFLYGLVIFALTVPIVGTGSTGYRLLTNLHMIDNPFLLWIGWFNGFSSNFLILYACFKTISQTYAEAAYIDGANEIKVLAKVMIPQAKPTIAAVSILGVIGMWSNYDIPLIQLPSYPNLALGIFMLQNASDVSRPVYFAAICLTMMPVLILFACCQKTIMSNISVGGIKG